MGKPKIPDETPPTTSLRPVKNAYEWKRIWRYVIVQPSVKCVGLACESFANGKDGTRVYPGVQRLMAITGYSNKPIVDALKTMRWLGFLHRYQVAARTPEGGSADRYQLCLPHDLSGIPMVDAETGTDPFWNDLTPDAQRVAELLGVAERIKRDRPDVLSLELGVLSTSERVDSVPNTKSPTKSMDHSAPHVAGQRASSQAKRYDFDDPQDRYAYIVDAFDDSLDPYEESSANGLLSKGYHPKEIVNMISRRRRGEAA